jgi:CheY-like chemotaxis protein
MSYVRLIHWNADEAEERAQQLRPAGYETISATFDAAALRALRDEPPDAVVIDLTRAPSQGRDIAVRIRKYMSTRHVPLVLVEGDPKKVERIKTLLPDAVYTTWNRIGDSLKEAIACPLADPVVPGSVMDAYSNTPLPKKLGVKTGSAVFLANAPKDFEQTLSQLPPDVVLHRDSRRGSDVTLWFTTSRAEIERGIVEMTERAAKGGLWIIWPKKSSGVESDLSQPVVREVAMAAGLVDFKVCSVDKTWSGLRFSREKTPAQ